VFATAESFTQRALAFNGERAQPLADVDLSAATGVIAGLQEHFPLVCIYADREDACYIGRVEKVTSKTLVLHEIDSEAHWIDESTRWRLGDIIRVDAGGRYVVALDALAATAANE